MSIHPGVMPGAAFRASRPARSKAAGTHARPPKGDPGTPIQETLAFLPPPYGTGRADTPSVGFKPFP